MNLKALAADTDSIVPDRSIAEAVEGFPAEDAKTSDDNQVTTSNKVHLVEKIGDFTTSIATINEITYHFTIVERNVSASEFIFDFHLKDHSVIYWHEVIRRIWNDKGKAVHVEYVNA